jgi:hypothetical protein
VLALLHLLGESAALLCVMSEFRCLVHSPTDATAAAACQMSLSSGVWSCPPST